MRFFVAPQLRHFAVVITGAALLGSSLGIHAAADEQDGEKKPSLVRRLFGGGDKEKKDEEEKKKSPAPEPKKSSPTKKKETDTDKPKAAAKKKDSDSDKPKAAPKKKESDSDKPSGKPKSKITLTPTGDGEAPSKPKPKPEPEKRAESKPSKDRESESEFGKTTEEGSSKSSMSLNDRFKPADGPTPAASNGSSPGVVENNIPLPPIDSAFEIVKADGRDYVTAESIHRFYRFSGMRMDGNNVVLNNPTLILKATLGSQEILMNNIKFILSYPFTTVAGKPAFSRLDLCKLIDPVLLPSHISDADRFDTVVVDAGHGGHDSGARGVYGFEKDFTLQMALAVKTVLIQRGFKVVMTRSTDEFISLGGRAEIANKTPHSIFLSLHFNSSGPAANGIETFALSPQGTASTFMGQRSSDYQAFSGNHQDSANIALATAVHAMVIHKFKLVDRGIKRARWSVLTGCNRPGILFEGGFVTNGTECRLIASSTYRQAVAEAIGDAIVNYRRALQPRVAQPSVKGR